MRCGTQWSAPVLTLRSANSQILILIRNCIDQFEKKHGEIG